MPAVADQPDQPIAIPSGTGHFAVGASCAIAAVPLFLRMTMSGSSQLNAAPSSILRHHERGPPHDRYYPAPLRDLSLFGESSDWSWSQGPGMGIGGDPRDYAKTRPDGADRRLP